MDMSTLYLLLFLSVILFLVSLFCAATQKDNVLTAFCMFVSGLIFWVISNSYVSGSLTKINDATGTADIIIDGVASDIFMMVGLMAFAGFAIQVFQAISTSGVVEELGE